jgi:NADH-quinone oxidoreductase subunit D
MFHAFREREEIVTLLEKLSGARLLYHYVRIGGVQADVTPEIAAGILRVCDLLDSVWNEYNDLLTYNDIFLRRCVGIGVLTREKAIAHGCTGPMARASGLDWDLRRDEPYSVYPRFGFEVAVPRPDIGIVGDSWQRHWIRLEEIRQSVRILRQAVEGLPEGPIQSKVPRVLKPPAGEVYVSIENPRGELGFYLISDGSAKPYRCRVRAPSFCNLSVTSEIARECLLADVVAVIGSIDIVLGEVDR